MKLSLFKISLVILVCAFASPLQKKQCNRTQHRHCLKTGLCAVDNHINTEAPHGNVVINETVNGIPITSGDSGVITFFTDTVFQCISGQPTGNALAINPLLLGFSEVDWTNLYKDTDKNNIPWCGKSLTVTANGQSFTGQIIDTCDPVGNPFKDPNTGQIIGGKCDYTNAIDLFGQSGLDFLNGITNGNDFYDGKLTWTLN